MKRNDLIQYVRFLDVAVIAPSLFYLSSKNTLDKKSKTMLEALAFGVLVFNLTNFLIDNHDR